MTSNRIDDSVVISTRDVTRRFGDVVALDRVSLDVGAGEFVGLLGPNGAGKSTLLTLLQGLRHPTSGTVEIFGRNPTHPAARRELGCTPQETALPPTLRVREVLDLVGAHFESPVAPEALAEEFGFTDLLKRQAGGLSGGQRRRIAVAMAFAGKPRLVLLDEPTTGLDVDARATLWAALRRRHEEGTTIVVTSHYLEEIEALARRVVVIADGTVLADDRIGAVLNRVGHRMITLSTPQPDLISGIPGALHVADALETADPGADALAADDSDGQRVTITAQDSDVFVRELVRRDVPFRDLTVRGASLEEAFRALTTTPTDSSASLEGRAA